MDFRRTLACIAVALICVFAGFVTCTPYQNGARKYTHTADKTKLGVSTQGEDNATDCADNSNGNSPQWYAAFKRPDGMLVLVGIATFLVVGWQAWETRRSVLAATVSALAARINSEALIGSERA
jgi:hypothetical protein